MNKDVIVIGAGASGLFCARECGKRGRSVLVLDHGARIGSKIRISGGGRCNFTNLQVTADNYFSANPHFCKSALARFTPNDFLELLKKNKITWYEKEAGQLFCTHSSGDIISLLQRECDASGVELRLGSRISDVQRSSCYTVATDQGVFQSKSLVIATGGVSYENLGASGFGHTIARQFGLSVTELRPALVPFVFSTRDHKTFQGLAGISLNAAITCNSKVFVGNILFTHRGLSGPAVLQASLYWKPGEAIRIDLMPGQDLLAHFMENRQSRMEMHNFLSGAFPKRFAQKWCDLLQASKTLNQYSDKELKSIADGLHRWELTPKSTEGYGNAEVTAGGVATGELSSKTMEATKAPGLYFIGEVLDVTGQLGGYNLHWAWASGFAAGQYA